jgi:hypothetical protein
LFDLLVVELLVVKSGLDHMYLLFCPQGEGLLRDTLHLEIDLTPAFIQPFKTISCGSSWAILRDLAGIWNIPCSRYSESTFQHQNKNF